MASAKCLAILFCFSCVLLLICFSQCASSLAAPPPSHETVSSSCKSYRFSNNGDQVFQSCTDLPVLSSFLHWTYYPATMTADIAFRKTGTSTTSWVVWSLNPRGPRMLGSQALVAFHNSAGVPTAYTTQINSYQPTMQYANLSFGVSNIRAEYANGEMIIFAKLHLDSTLIKTNQVWQEGPMSGTSFGMHPMSSANLRCVGTIDFSTGAATPASSSNTNSKNTLKNVHGVLNAVSWGFMMPVGIMLARYLKAFKVTHPYWFNAHRGWQSIAFLIGIGGWGTGMYLGYKSPGITHCTHKILGIIIFCFAILQVLSLFLRLKPDHKYRLYWNIYHRTIGYAIVAMSIANIYEGFRILELQADHHIWRYVYTGVVIFLAFAAAVLEIVTWSMLLCCNNNNNNNNDSHNKTTSEDAVTNNINNGSDHDSSPV